MLKALNDLSTLDFSELFQLNELSLWLKVKWTLIKNFVFPISTLLDLVKGFVQYFGPVIWNSIPAKIRNAKTLSSFKKKI